MAAGERPPGPVHATSIFGSPTKLTTLLLVLLALLLFVVEHINGRFWLNDFRVYYGAAQALLHGEALYGVAHGLDSGVFKYAPAMALLFAPLAMLPYGVAASLHFALIVAAFIIAWRTADRMLRDHLLGGRQATLAPLLITLVVVVVHLHRELHLGNINALLLCALLLALDRCLQGKMLAAGLLIGIAILAKPHFVVLLPLFLLRRHWKPVVTAVATLLAGLLLPALALGFRVNKELHATWLDQMARHNASLFYTGGDGYEAVNTLYSFLHRSALGHVLASPSPIEAYVTLGSLALVFGLFVLLNIRYERVRDASLPFEFMLLLALVPSITLTDTEHFLLALPLVAWLVHQLMPKARPSWLPVVAIPILLAHGGNWQDALGPFSDRMVHYGILGMANLGLMVLSAYLFLRRRSDIRVGSASNMDRSRAQA